MTDPAPDAEFVAFLRQLRDHVDLEQSFGATHCTRRPPSATEKKAERLRALADSIGNCAACPLHETRHRLVFGEGNPDADLMFIGEAPGRDEDMQGRPFIGRAGQLLTKIIHAMEMTREDVYIANVLKCRPPNNRNPSLKEMTACGATLLKQIEIIEPVIIVGLGGVAANFLLDMDRSVGSLRGRFHDFPDFPGCRLRVTYHPAYLLRNPSAKRGTWEDMKAVRDALRTGVFD